MIRKPSPVIIAVGLFAVALGIYIPVVNYEFLNFDDLPLLIMNKDVREGLTLGNLIWAFTSRYGDNWIPLTWLTHMTDWTLYGWWAGGHHFTNALLHAANTTLLFLFLWRSTRALWRSAAVAVLFGIHPLHVESVAWIAERKDVLSTFFGLLALLAYVRYGRRGGTGPYLVTLSLFACSLMSKAMLVTMPFVLILVDIWPLGRLRLPGQRGHDGLAPGAEPCSPTALRRAVAEKVPFLALSAAISVVTVLYQQDKGAIASLSLIPLGARIGNMLISYVKYLGMTFYPVGLSVFYRHTAEAPFWASLGAALLLLLFTVAVALKGLRLRWLITGWLWYLGTLVPVIGLVQVGSQALADRYTYIPLVGIFIVLTWGGHALLGNKKGGGPILAVLAAATFLEFGGMTLVQLRYWRNSVTLFKRAIEIDPKASPAWYNLGLDYHVQGRYEEANRCLRVAALLRPSDPDVRNDIGATLVKQGKLDSAVLELRWVLDREPDHWNAQTNMATALRLLAARDSAKAESTMPDMPLPSPSQ